MGLIGFPATALETLHLTFSSSGRLMGVLGSVVAPSTSLMSVL